MSQCLRPILTIWPRGADFSAALSAARAAGAVLGADLAGAVCQPLDPSLTPLRPPGATDEFEQRCRSCGRCARACPHGAIRMTPRPAVVAAVQPCRMCEGFPCAAACPSGAQAMPKGPVRMGIAIWSALRCPVSAGGECDICHLLCPAGAVRVDAGRIRVDGDRCTGCGLCEHSCPQRPRAIYIDPL